MALAKAATDEAVVLASREDCTHHGLRYAVIKLAQAMARVLTMLEKS